MQPHLEDLAEELLESITILLDFTNVRNLRLTSRTISAKCSRGSFRNHFRTKTVDLFNPEMLHAFTQVTRAPQLGCLLRNVVFRTAAGLAPDSQLNPTNQGLMLQGFTNLESLDMITLEVVNTDASGVVLPPSPMLDNWRSIWTLTSELYISTLDCISRSRLSVGNLRVYTTIDRCSLASDVLSSIQAPTLWSNLRCLSLSISHKVRSKALPDAETLSTNAEQDIRALAYGLENVLQQCAVLEELDLHWYDLNRLVLYEDEFNDAKLLNFFEAAPGFPKLQACTLRGFRAKSAALLQFLQNAKLKRIHMTHVSVQHGTFRPIFDHIATMPLESLRLDDLTEGREVLFEGPGKPNLRRIGRNGPEYLERFGKAATKPIKYNLATGRTLGSGKVYVANAMRVLRYGPPDMTTSTPWSATVA